jgi:hypothetical protein
MNVHDWEKDEIGWRCANCDHLFEDGERPFHGFDERGAPRPTEPIFIMDENMDYL